MRRLGLLLLLLLGVLTAGWAIFYVATHTGMLNATNDGGGGASHNKKLSLSQEQLAYLWDLEHHANLLTKYGLGPLGEALRNQDRTQIETIMSPDFGGLVLDQGREVKFKGKTVSAMRRDRSQASNPPVNRSEFITWLLDQRRRYAGAFHVKLAVSQLTPGQDDNQKGEWRGRIKMRMWGETQPGKPAETFCWLALRFAKPTRERLAKPGWLTSCKVTQFRRSRSSRALFREVAAERGLQPERFYDIWNEKRKISQTGGLYACDYNRDGFTDLLVTDVNSPGLVLYEGLAGGKFKEVTRQVGLLTESGRRSPGLAAVCVFVDVNNDGWEDLLSASGAVYLNRGGKRFEFATEKTNLFLLLTGPKAPDQSRIGGMIAGDYDRDGKIDLYVVRSAVGKDPHASWIETETSPSTGNQLLRNLGNLQFEDVTQSSGVKAGGRSVFTAAWLDAGNDGWPDLYVINEFGKGVLLVNEQNGKFKERDIVIDGPGDFGAMGLACGDYDNDGRIDIYSANMYSKAGNRVMNNLPKGVYSDDVMAKLKRLVSGSRLYRNGGELKFERKAELFQIHDIGWAYGPALADLNNDGWLDLYATCGFVSRDRKKPDG